VRIVAETGRTPAEGTRDPGINETALATRVSRARQSGTAGSGEASANSAQMTANSASAVRPDSVSA
jgi:hypothetical protein